MIGTTRRENPITRTIDWTRVQTFGKKEVPSNAPETVVYSVLPEKEAGKTIFQIGTADPELAVQAARLIAADVSGIDVNAGCPKPFSTHSGMGAALLRTPDKLVAILEALIQNITPEFNIGISVKIRLLETAAETEALVRRLCATGITALTIHCRTTPMRPREAAIRGQLRMVANVCHEAGVACLMNGDVESRDHGLKLMEEYGTDGAMIATSAETNFSCFRAEADGGIAPWREVAETYIKYALDVHNKFGNTKYLLCQIVPGKKPEYKQIIPCKNYAHLCEVFELKDDMERAQELDRQVEAERESAKADKKAKAAKANNSALAAGGNMAGARGNQNRKGLSERGPRTAQATTETQPQVETAQAQTA
jgi:tRNA-dihydrouridine synthase 2